MDEDKDTVAPEGAESPAGEPSTPAEPTTGGTETPADQPAA